MEAFINKIQELNLKNYNENYLINNNISCRNINTMLNGMKQDEFLIIFIKIMNAIYNLINLMNIENIHLVIKYKIDNKKYLRKIQKVNKYNPLFIELYNIPNGSTDYNLIKIDIIFNNISINIYPNFDYLIDKYLNINLNKEFNIEYNKNSLFKENLRLKTLSKSKYNLIYENNSDNIYIKKILKYYLSKTTKKQIYLLII